MLRCNFPSTSSYYVALPFSLLITLQAIRPLTAGDLRELEQMETPLDAERVLEFKEHALLFWKGESGRSELEEKEWLKLKSWFESYNETFIPCLSGRAEEEEEEDDGDEVERELNLKLSSLKHILELQATSNQQKTYIAQCAIERKR